LGVLLALAAWCGGQTRTPEIWRQPTTAIANENMLAGAGGPDGGPHGDYTFVKEDMNGSNPKIVVRDGDHIKWTVKMGAEAQPETVASRFVWAVGYFTRENYWLPRIEVKHLPAHLKRGSNLVRGGVIENVRLERMPEGEKKIGEWKWDANPFSGTRELHGLAVVMALINNWDLKEVNNAVYKDREGNAEYVVSDLGASFGGNREGLSAGRSKGNLKAYETSGFITKATPEYVDFATPALPDPLDDIRFPLETRERISMRSVTRHIPRPDAKWVGDLLSQLTPAQIRDAFLSAGYTQSEADAYAAIVEERIRHLSEL